MRRKFSLILSVLLLLLLAALPVSANDASDLELILASAKPGQPFKKPAFLQLSRESGADILYEGNLGDIEVLTWVTDGVVDSLFLMVKGRQCDTWLPVVTRNFDPPTIEIANHRGQMHRFYSDSYEYYLVLGNKYNDKIAMTDLSIFQRGVGREVNDRYHEFGDIWGSQLTPKPAE